MLFYIDFYAKTKIRVYGDFEKVAKSTPDNILGLCNHQCAVDFVNVEYLVTKLGKLGAIRHVTKDPFQFIPIIGYTFFMHLCIYVKSGKGDKFDAKHTNKTLDYIKNNDIPQKSVQTGRTRVRVPGDISVEEDSISDRELSSIKAGRASTEEFVPGANKDRKSTIPDPVGNGSGGGGHTTED
ncbi:unnamed protein product [Medioppia subpectinata]|uniref:Phospholipid/glycerol acyltransferase domain-containing protein n=1 Tax=Medioppia subpectinata TaxID=1979941 RepID=A0A7R9Q8A8_9ACAR|nr:unnamed protein product [Medioppia subpectinata]CAG2115643.1 unnamed protein product [Medioppia subpectinata]